MPFSLAISNMCLVSWKFERIVEKSFHIYYRDGSCRRLWRCLQLPFLFVSLGCRNSKLKLYLCTQVEIIEMKKERETANKYRQQALEGDLMAMNNMGVPESTTAHSMNSAILWLMSRIVRIKRRSFMKSFIAINLFGMIVTCEDLSKVELNHELIHTAQARELLYIPFYLWYIIEWFYLYLRYRDWMRAYYNIRFEKEAYAHQEDLEYLNRRKHYCYRWCYVVP